MIFGSQNLFCEPAPLLETLAQAASLVQWSADGVTYQAGPAPGSTNIYIRVIAPDGLDVSAAAYIGQPAAAGHVTVSGQTVTRTTTDYFTVSSYDFLVLEADETTVILDAGTLTFY
jgi:hypothetical protein